MSKQDNGGPAFPCDGFQTQTGDIIPIEGISGMSLRDYFAAKAMQGMQSNVGANDWTTTKFAQRAYEMADAMLRAKDRS